MGTLLEHHLLLQDAVDDNRLVDDFEHLGKEYFNYRRGAFMTKKFSMVAGGTDIISCYLVRNEIVKATTELKRNTCAKIKMKAKFSVEYIYLDSKIH